ncbi:L-lactate dehydrogenase complex protein LldG [Mucilaginibacter frigoritolerans]|uniref:L-lactate dehydrogenase complex protein LldG n=2 Tax=Mucilaginibacter frigoritolerans TaxID=652788 RepID=A0A562TPG1_9SPHI|nr:L-lactate dehydrogenase complex protein LldG [Mucilaginibacter frigoritolerans]
MSSRDSILKAVKENQPEKAGLPDISVFKTSTQGSLSKFAAALNAVGGKIAYVSDYGEILHMIKAQYGDHAKVISPMKELAMLCTENFDLSTPVHSLHDVDVAILKGQFGVAENGAVWITDKEMVNRALPFITQHLVAIIDWEMIVPTMHDSYELISRTRYGFGTFIAGPSKTADIEQSLVIGAHGPRSMTVYVMG